jgi:PIN domain nuclease of toxin-antitoxin system
MDTCAVIWATLGPDKLSDRARRIIKDERNVPLVSAASAWEISAKVRLGRLPEAQQLELGYIETMEIAGYTLLNIDAECALRAGRLSGEHRDPFDRMLAAQALALEIRS